MKKRYIKERKAGVILRRAAAVTMSLMMVFAMMPALTGITGGKLGAAAAYAATVSYTAKLTFTESGIEATEPGTGYKISGTTLKIEASGVYDITGSCSNGSIEVAKDLKDVTLILDGLTLASVDTAPIVVKKNALVTIHLAKGTISSLCDNETDPDAKNYEGAAIKAKGGSSVTFCGPGNLNIEANSKNGIKGGSTAALTFNQTGTIAVYGSYKGHATEAGAVNNGIASDGSVTINQGVFDIDAANDGIKSCPDATSESEGTKLDAESEGKVTINGGVFMINVDGDGIQADTLLTINNGIFAINTLSGYNTDGTKYNTNNKTGSSHVFDPDTMSAKGLKGSGDRAEEVGTEPAIVINGGEFTLDCADDAIHSDGDATVTGGTFTIDSGDDGMHADKVLDLGVSGGAAERDPYVIVSHGYEGLEGGIVNMYQGVYNVTVSDDGINAAGGKDGSGAEQGGGFKPTGTGDYAINIFGGDLYIDCGGDGIDANGIISLTGGHQAVFSMSRGVDSAIDADKSVTIDGAVIFTSGSKGVSGTVQSKWFGKNQKYATTSTSYSKNDVIDTKAGRNGAVVFSYKLPKATSYTMASWPSSLSASAPSIAKGNSLQACKGGSESHSWDDGEISKDQEGSLIIYTCSKCHSTEIQTFLEDVEVPPCAHSAEISPDDCSHLALTSPVWNWTSDYSSAVLTLICTRCDAELEYNAAVETQITDKTVTYTAKVTVNGTEYTDTTIITIPDDDKPSGGGGGSGTTPGTVTPGGTAPVTAATPQTTAEIQDLPGVKIKSATGAKRSATVKWKKLNKTARSKVAKIEVQCSQTPDFTQVVKATAKKTATSCKVKKLRANTTYYIRIRTTKVINGTTHVSPWSKVKKVKTK